MRTQLFDARSEKSKRYSFKLTRVGASRVKALRCEVSRCRNDEYRGNQHGFNSIAYLSHIVDFLSLVVSKKVTS